MGDDKKKMWSCIKRLMINLVHALAEMIVTEAAQVFSFIIDVIRLHTSSMGCVWTYYTGNKKIRK